MGKLIQQLWRWLRSQFGGRWIRHVTVVDAADEVPERLPPGVVVVVGTSRRPKWIVFECPCARGHRVWLNSQPSHSPHWMAGGAGRQLTIWPSVWVGAPWGCHFWVRRGRVIWTR